MLGVQVCPWIGSKEPGNREVMRSAKLTEKMKSIINRNTSVSTWLKMITSDNVDDKDDAFDDGKALVAYKGCSQLKRLRPLARRDISDHNT